MSAIRSAGQTHHSTIGWNIWFEWVLASICGYGIGAALGNAIATSIPPMICTLGSSDALIERLPNLLCILPGLDLALLVVILGLVAGSIQWLVLRHWISNAGWWVLASALGFPIALVIAVGVGLSLGGSSTAAPILLGVVFGVLSGIMPWFVLRHQVARASWWVPAHLLGSLVGGGLGIVAFHAMALLRLYQFPWTAAGAMFGAGLGAITGITLVWLLRHTISAR